MKSGFYLEKNQFKSVEFKLINLFENHIMEILSTQINIKIFSTIS